MKQVPNNPMATPTRTPLQLARDVILLASILIVCITTIFFYATPTTILGGVTEHGNTQNVFGFIYFDDNSIINQILQAISTIENVDTANPMATVNSTLKIARYFFLVIPTAIFSLQMLICLISGAVSFCTKKSNKLGTTAAKNIANRLIVYVFFYFFANMSGGVGENGYFLGYTVGLGSTIGTVIGFVLLIVGAFISKQINEKAMPPYVREQVGDNKWKQALCNVLVCFALGIGVALLRMYSVFSYVLNSALLSVASIIVNQFDLSVLIFPVLNLILFACCATIYSTLPNKFVSSSSYLFSYGDYTVMTNQREWEKLNKDVSKGFIFPIICSVLSIICVLILSNPAYGLGWSVDIYYQLVWLFVASATGQALSALFAEKKQPTPIATMPQYPQYPQYAGQPSYSPYGQQPPYPQYGQPQPPRRAPQARQPQSNRPTRRQPARPRTTRQPKR